MKLKYLLIQISNFTTSAEWSEILDFLSSWSWKTETSFKIVERCGETKA